MLIMLRSKVALYPMTSASPHVDGEDEAAVFSSKHGITEVSYSGCLAILAAESELHHCATTPSDAEVEKNFSFLGTFFSFSFFQFFIASYFYFLFADS